MSGYRGFIHHIARFTFPSHRADHHMAITAKFVFLCRCEGSVLVGYFNIVSRNHLTKVGHGAVGYFKCVSVDVLPQTVAMWEAGINGLEGFGPNIRFDIG